MLHFGRKSRSYWSVSLTRKRCIDAQPIITALSVAKDMCEFGYIDLSSPVTDLCIDMVGEIQAKVEYLN